MNRICFQFSESVLLLSILLFLVFDLHRVLYYQKVLKIQFQLFKSRRVPSQSKALNAVVKTQAEWCCFYYNSIYIKWLSSPT